MMGTHCDCLNPDHSGVWRLVDQVDMEICAACSRPIPGTATTHDDEEITP